MSTTDIFNYCNENNHSWDTSGTVCLYCGFNLLDKNFNYGEIIGAWDEYGDENIDKFVEEIYRRRSAEVL